jgi:hypothetical protein
MMFPTGEATRRRLGQRDRAQRRLRSASNGGTPRRFTATREGGRRINRTLGARMPWKRSRHGPGRPLRPRPGDIPRGPGATSRHGTGTPSSTWRAEGTAPVRSFPPNGYGLFDMAGNVWEWTTDWYAANREGNPCCEAGSYDPQQPRFRVPRRVIKGGSFLCADNYCLRYRPAARRPQMIDTGMSHIGFRCVTRTVPVKM